MSQYACVADLSTFGIPDDALFNTSDSDKNFAMIAASAEIDGYIGAQYKLPLTSWGLDITRACVHIAIYDLMARRGFMGTNNDQIHSNRADAIRRWLRDVSIGKCNPVGIVDQTPNVHDGGFRVITNPRRWD